MTLTLQTPNGELPVSDAVVEQVIGCAERAAELAATSLAAMPGFSREGKLPAAVVLEVAAIVQLQIWEEGGAFASWPADLLTYDAARHHFIERTKNGPGEFSSLGAAELSIELMRFQLSRLAWDSPLLGNGNIIITVNDEESFVEAIAQFLFENRNVIDGLISKD